MHGKDGEAAPENGNIFDELQPAEFDQQATPEPLGQTARAYFISTHQKEKCEWAGTRGQGAVLGGPDTAAGIQQFFQSNFTMNSANAADMMFASDCYASYLNFCVKMGWGIANIRHFGEWVGHNVGVFRSQHRQGSQHGRLYAVTPQPGRPWKRAGKLTVHEMWTMVGKHPDVRKLEYAKPGKVNPSDVLKRFALEKAPPAHGTQRLALGLEVLPIGSSVVRVGLKQLHMAYIAWAPDHDAALMGYMRFQGLAVTIWHCELAGFGLCTLLDPLKWEKMTAKAVHELNRGMSDEQRAVINKARGFRELGLEEKFNVEV